MALTQPYVFQTARPVWQTGRETEMNVSVCAVARVPAGKTSIALATSGSYVLIVNGRFVCHGPSRCAHGWYKVDVYDLTPFLTERENFVAVRCAGYCVNSFEYPEQPSFLCAEIDFDGRVVAASGGEGFCWYDVTERLQRVARYSFQRPFMESYRVGPGAFAYETGGAANECAVSLTSPKRFIRADGPYPDGDEARPVPIFAGTVALRDENLIQHDRCLDRIGPDFHGFRREEWDDRSPDDLLRMEFTLAEKPLSRAFSLAENEFVMTEFARAYAGILSFDVTIEGEGDVYLYWDEILGPDRLIAPWRLQTTNIIRLHASGGRYRIVTAEPYVMKYLQLIAVGCRATVENLLLHKITFPLSQIKKEYAGRDAALRAVFEAARESFVSNATDIYTDCPSRERAGWLCDSFFIARTEYALTGCARVERAFLLNFLLTDSVPRLPDGMLPMCYPADFLDGSFIPNWAMWYFLELEEYLGRTGDRELVDAARGKATALLGFFRRFENEFGLLENLPGWVFVEWSQANAFTQPVNFPTNMLYARFKQALGALYDDPRLLAEAEALRRLIRDKAMTESGFFADNAVRADGRLVAADNRTEACQYYAFFFGVAAPQTYPDLWETLIRDFGFDRRHTGKHPEIWPANAFMGNYMRLDLLLSAGLREKLIAEIREYFGYMAARTGTLWEHDGPVASCNHGFASYVICWYEALGLLREKRSL
ncbi:MAG: hypothetical protein KIG36_04910 [Eubacteriales bacterium]|nr:hypothetical protein [Eubacteriales bacterium]